MLDVKSNSIIFFSMIKQLKKFFEKRFKKKVEKYDKKCDNINGEKISLVYQAIWFKAFRKVDCEMKIRRGRSEEINKCLL